MSAEERDRLRVLAYRLAAFLGRGGFGPARGRARPAPAASPRCRRNLNLPSCLNAYVRSGNETNALLQPRTFRAPRTTASPVGFAIHCFPRPRSSRYCSAVYSPKSVIRVSPSESRAPRLHGVAPACHHAESAPCKRCCRRQLCPRRALETITFIPCSCATARAESAVRRRPILRFCRLWNRLITGIHTVVRVYTRIG